MMLSPRAAITDSARARSFSARAAASRSSSASRCCAVTSAMIPTTARWPPWVVSQELSMTSTRRPSRATIVYSKGRCSSPRRCISWLRRTFSSESGAIITKKSNPGAVSSARVYPRRSSKRSLT